MKSIECIGRLCTKCDFNAYTSRIIHPLIQIVNASGSKVDGKLFNAVMGTLSLMMIRMGPDFLVFASMINRTLAGCKRSHGPYQKLLHNLIHHGFNVTESNMAKLTKTLFPNEEELKEEKKSDDEHDEDELGRLKTVEIVDEMNMFDSLGEHENESKEMMAEVPLQQAWNITGRAAERDWFAWLHGFVESENAWKCNEIFKMLRMLENAKIFTTFLKNVEMLSKLVAY